MYFCQFDDIRDRFSVPDVCVVRGLDAWLNAVWPKKCAAFPAWVSHTVVDDSIGVRDSEFSTDSLAVRILDWVMKSWKSTADVMKVPIDRCCVTSHL